MKKLFSKATSAVAYTAIVVGAVAWAAVGLVAPFAILKLCMVALFGW